MDRWFGAALDYIPQCLGFQMRARERPGRIAEAGGGGSYGEPMRRVRNGRGAVVAVQFSYTRFLPEATLAAEIAARYGRRRARRRVR